MDQPLIAFNRGLVSRFGLARQDVKRIASFSAEEMTNFIPRVLGPMSIRPGWKYLGSVNGNLASKLIPFVFSVDDTALIEISADTLRVWRNDALITRVTVGTGVVNGDFTSNLNDWTDNDESGATSDWLTGDGTNAAIRDQAVTVSGGDVNLQHALRIVISKGPVWLRVGSALGSDNYINDTKLGTGDHSLTFTPAGSFWIRFYSRLARATLVSSVAVEAAGVMSVPSPWSASDLDNLRWDASGDIVFVACQDQQQYMIERRSVTSWSVVKYEPEDGPFLSENTGPITLTASAIVGTITLTASKSLFRTSQVGGLYSLTSEGQTVTRNISAADNFTDAIRITGVDSSRVFTILISGTWSATVTLQRSLESEDGPWEDITSISWTANTTETFDDGLDNQIAWYRLGVKTGQYTSGTVVASLSYALGSIRGVVRITAVTDSVTVTADVLEDLGGTTATEVWAEGAWSDRRGWPTAVALHEGRLWWAGKSKVWGSVSDAYDSFNPDVEGDSGPISRTLGVGPVDRINWLFSSSRLLMGGDLNEYNARSSSLDEPLTPTIFNVKATSTQGSAAVAPGAIDSKVVFANRTGMKVFENAQLQAASEYTLTDLCQLVPEIGSPGIVRIVTQRQPDTRIHAIRSDGTVALAVYDRAEDVLGWCEIETDGEVEDAAVLPAHSGVTDDYVYYIVKREINGATKRYLEKWSQQNEGLGGLGEDGTGSPFEAFTLGQFAATDQTSQMQIFYSSLTDRVYVPGPTGDLLWVYNPADFTNPTTLTVGGHPIRTAGQSGALSQSGDYFFLSGDSGSPGYPVRAVNLQTGAVTELGSAQDTIVTGANGTYLIVYEASQARAYTYNIGAGTRTLATAYAVPFLSSITNNGAWDASGAFWLINDFSILVRIKPGTAGFTTFTPPINFAHHVRDSQVVYDAERNRLIMSFTDSTIRAFSDWTVGVNDSGTWTTIKSSVSAQAFVFDTEQDALFSQDYSNFHVRRYYVPTMGQVDDVECRDTSGPDNPEIDYDLIASRQIAYDGSAAYVQVNKVGTHYICKIAYDGAPILYDGDGNSLQPGGIVGRINALADSFLEYTGANTLSVTGLGHLEGEEVVVWANGVDLGTDANYEQTYSIVSGATSPNFPEATSNITVGLAYRARYKTAKLGLQTQAGVKFGGGKRVAQMAILLANTHAKGVRWGPDFDHLDDRPGREDWADVDPDAIDTDYDKEPVAFPATWDENSRICLQAQAPRPCTVLAIQADMEG